MGEKKRKRLTFSWRDYALVGDKNDPSTWQLLHHTGLSPSSGDKDSREDTVDWELAAVAAASLSRSGYQGRRIRAGAHEKIAAAEHLAGHYRRAGRPLPNALAVLVKVERGDAAGGAA